jgi:hypothetical protein
VKNVLRAQLHGLPITQMQRRTPIPQLNPRDLEEIFLTTFLRWLISKASIIVTAKRGEGEQS